MKTRVKFGLVLCAIVILISSGCSLAGKGSGLGDSSKIGALYPDALTTPILVQPTAVSKSGSAQATATKATASSTTKPTGDYIVAKSATTYKYIVSDTTVVGKDGKIAEGYPLLKAGNVKVSDEERKTVLPEEIRWSDRMAIRLWNDGVLKAFVSDKPTYSEIFHLNMWVAETSLWINTRDPKVNVNAYAGNVYLPPDERAVSAWLSLAWYTNFDRANSTYKATLAQLGIDVKLFSDLPSGQTKDSVMQFMPKYYSLMNGG
jgi:hypothetical protein